MKRKGSDPGPEHGNLTPSHDDEVGPAWRAMKETQTEVPGVPGIGEESDR
jgi:hypothetical protein